MTKMGEQKMMVAASPTGSRANPMKMQVTVKHPIKPGVNVIKLFTAVIYCHSMVLPSFCVIKHWYCSKYHRMAVNNPDKKFYNIGPRGQT
jgi:hypothetical protein